MKIVEAQPIGDGLGTVPEGEYVRLSDYWHMEYKYHKAVKAFGDEVGRLRARVEELEQFLEAQRQETYRAVEREHAAKQQLAVVEIERNRCESFLARIASLRIDETGTACFSNSTDGRGIDAWRVAEQARQTLERVATLEKERDKWKDLYENGSP